MLRCYCFYWSEKSKYFFLHYTIKCVKVAVSNINVNRWLINDISWSLPLCYPCLQHYVYLYANTTCFMSMYIKWHQHTCEETWRFEINCLTCGHEAYMWSCNVPVCISGCGLGSKFLRLRFSSTDCCTVYQCLCLVDSFNCANSDNKKNQDPSAPPRQKEGDEIIMQIPLRHVLSLMFKS